MTPSVQTRSASDQCLVDLIDQIADKMRRGEAVSLEACVRQHPECEDRLRELFPALALMADLSVVGGDTSVSAAAGSSGAAVSSSPVTGELGDFRILREIGRGGMGVVYEAEQMSLHRRVALKMLPFAAVMDSRQLQRFQNEAVAAASLKHPNIVQVYSVGCERGVHYYAMEYVEGQTLAQVIEGLRASSPLPSAGEGPGVRAVGAAKTEPIPASTTPLDEVPRGEAKRSPSDGPDEMLGLRPSLPAERSSPAPSPQPLAPDTSPKAALSTAHSHRTPEFFRSVANWGIQAAEAIEHAHQLGVVHRDIKPSNLLLDAKGRLYVTDFGLAMVESGENLTMTGDILGTLRYMSPEQAQGGGGVLDHRTDIYSLGVTLYELSTLAPPFTAADRHELIHQIIDSQPRAPRQLNPAVPRDLETIILKAVAAEPAARYATAQQMADDLRRYLDDKPIRAKRAGPMVRLRKWTKRHKAVTAVVASLLLAAAVFGTATAVQAYQRDVRLTVMAAEGLADVRVAMAQQEFGQAQRRATEIQAELAASPKVKAQFGPELEDLLHQAEARLRLQRFEKLAEEARFQANALLVRVIPVGTTREKARPSCQEALAVFRALDNPGWVNDLERLTLQPAEVARVKEKVAELLFLLATVEARSQGGASGARRAIALLDQVEPLARDLRALYEYRSSYWRTLGNDEAAKIDSARAEKIQRTKWLDHYLHTVELWSANQIEEAGREIETAITLRVDDYWSWFLWGGMQGLLQRKDQSRWARTVCIHLRPDEPAAWLGRAMDTSGTKDLPARIADLSKVLELTPDKGLRGLAYRYRADARRGLGDLEGALGDVNEALRLDPRAGNALYFRAMCYEAMGQLDRARADALRALEVLPARGGSSSWSFNYRMLVYELLGQPREALTEAVEFYRTEELRFWSSRHTKSTEQSGNAQSTFLLAMVYWKLGQKDDARRLYDKALARIDKTKPEDQSVRRYREEAAKMIGAK